MNYRVYSAPAIQEYTFILYLGSQQQGSLISVHTYMHSVITYTFEYDKVMLKLDLTLLAKCLQVDLDGEHIKI